jgi:hypothetical protein
MTSLELLKRLESLTQDRQATQLDFIFSVMSLKTNMSFLYAGAAFHDGVIAVHDEEAKLKYIQQMPNVRLATIEELPLQYFSDQNSAPLAMEHTVLEGIVRESTRDIKMLKRFIELAALWIEYEDSTCEALSKLPPIELELVRSKAEQIRELLVKISNEV